MSAVKPLRKSIELLPGHVTDTDGLAFDRRFMLTLEMADADDGTKKFTSANAVRWRFNFLNDYFGCSGGCAKKREFASTGTQSPISTYAGPGRCNVYRMGAGLRHRMSLFVHRIGAAIASLFRSSSIPRGYSPTLVRSMLAHASEASTKA